MKNSTLNRGIDARRRNTADPIGRRLAPADYVRVVEQACEQRNLRLTPLRAKVLRLVVKARRPIKAYDVLAKMIAMSGDTAPTTAYRALDFLTEHGFIHRLASLNAYVACLHPETRHSVPFLICEKCQAVIELGGGRIVALLNSMADAHDFQPRAQTLEMHGFCAACRNQ
jgi:Fur family zinc uptake transcriptional regulator